MSRLFIIAGSLASRVQQLILQKQHLNTLATEPAKS
jgi:hypothetical protein